jgi:hypothetical protein
MTRERNDSGQYVETVGLDGVLAVFDQVAGPVITSSDVSGALDCTTEAARQKLTRLYDQGRVDRRKTGRTMVYWRADAQGDESGRERRETPPADTAVDLDSLTFKRELTPARRAVLVAWIDHLRELGDSVKKSDFEVWFTEDHEAQAGYNTGAFWEAFAKATMKQSDQFAKPNAREYRFVGDQDTDALDTEGPYDPSEEF